MKESDELLDVRRRLKFVESLMGFLENLPPNQAYKWPILLADLHSEVELLKSEVLVWQALEASQ